MTGLRQIMLEELRRHNYAKSTTHVYIQTVEHFSRHFHRSPDQLGPGAHSRVSGRVVHAVEEVPKHGDAAVGSAAFLMFRFEARLSVARPVSKESCVCHKCSARKKSTFIDAGEFPFHRILLMTLYHGAASRGSGAPEDQRHRQPAQGHSYPGRQGSKDRDVMLSPKLLEALRVYLRGLKRKPTNWLFPGNRWHTATHPVTTKVLWHACQQAAEHAGLEHKRDPSPHSCATALPHICSKPVPTCAPSRCCWDIATWKNAIFCICPGDISAPPAVHWIHSRSEEKENKRRTHEPATSGGGRHRSLCRTVLHIDKADHGPSSSSYFHEAALDYIRGAQLLP